MAIFQWDASYSVKVAEIDEQHKKIVGMINALDDAMRQGKGKEVMSNIITELIRYTATHFATEEKYFAQLNYPDTEAHKKEHSDFVKKVTDFKQGFQTGKLGLTIQVMNFLTDWLKTHIKGTDQKYSAFFNQHGIK